MRIRMAKVMIPLLTMLLLLTMASLVMACKSDGQCVPASAKTLAEPYFKSGVISNTPRGLILLRDFQADFIVKLTIGGTTYNVYSSTTFDAVFNPKTGVVDNCFDVVWYVSAKGSADGFAGDIRSIIYGVTSIPPTTSTWTTALCVLHGFGSFKGQTLMLSYNGPTPGGVLPGGTVTGFDLIKGQENN